MDDPSDFTDCDWRAFDEMLRCPICREIYSTQNNGGTRLLVKCSHSFHTLCLEQALAAQNTADKECPKCREQLSNNEQSIVRNKHMDDLCQLYVRLRPSLIKPPVMGQLSRQCFNCGRSDVCTEEEFNLHMNRCIDGLDDKFGEQQPILIAQENTRKKLKFRAQFMKNKELKDCMDKYKLTTKNTTHEERVKRFNEFQKVWNASCDPLDSRTDQQIVDEVEAKFNTVHSTKPSERQQKAHMRELIAKTRSKQKPIVITSDP